MNNRCWLPILFFAWAQLACQVPRTYGQTTTSDFGDIFDSLAALQTVAAEGRGGEGPAWDPQLGILTSGNGNINRLDNSGKASVLRSNAGTNGLLFDRDGSLLACEPGERRVSRTLRDGSVQLVTDRFEGKRYNTPNDLTLDSKGRIYFSDPRYGSREGMEIIDAAGKTIEGVYCVHPDRRVIRVIGRQVQRANGVLVSAEDRFLYVADNANNVAAGARKLWRFNLQPDGSVDLQSQHLIHDWGQGRGPDGLKQDMLGNLYVAAGTTKSVPPFEPDNSKRGGIYVFSPAGKLVAFLHIPRDEVTNCAFGGEDRKTLYVTGGGTLFSIRTRNAGRVIWP